MFSIYYIHDHTSFQHLSQANLDGEIRRGSVLAAIGVHRLLCMTCHGIDAAHGYFRNGVDRPAVCNWKRGWRTEIILVNR